MTYTPYRNDHFCSKLAFSFTFGTKCKKTGVYGTKVAKGDRNTMFYRYKAW